MSGAAHPGDRMTAAGVRHPVRGQREPAIAALIVAILGLLAVFVVLPLGAVLLAGLRDDGGLTFRLYRELVAGGTLATPLRNSLVLGATVAVSGTAVGYAAAYILVMVAPPGRRLFRLVAMLPMIAPPFMIALAAIMLLGRNGVITRHVLMPLLGADRVPDIYGFGGLAFVQTLTCFPTSMLLLIGVLAALDPALEEAAQSQGASPRRAFRDVVLPLSLPGVLASMLLLFIESLADFGNPLILGGDFRVLSVAAYLRITGEYDTAGGAILATALLVPAVAAFLVQRRWAERLSFATLSARPTTSRRPLPTRTARAAALGGAAVMAGTVCLFFGAVAYGSVVEVWGVSGTLTVRNYIGAFAAARHTLADSLILAAVATPAAGLLGLAIAWLNVRRRFTGRALMHTLAMLTFAVPGTAVGIGWILAFNAPPLQLTGTAAIIVLLFIFRSVPVGIEAGNAAIRQIDPAIEEGSASLGATPAVTFRRILLPLIAPAFFAGLAHAFVRSITAVSAVIFVVSGQWNLVTVSILGFVENGELSRASALCIILVALVGGVLAAMHALVSRHASRGPRFHDRPASARPAAGRRVEVPA